MRIAVAAPNRHVLGGAEHYLRVLVPALRAAGHDLAILFEEDDPAVPARIDDDLRGSDTRRLDADAADDALGWLAAWKPGVVYSQGLSAAALEARIVAAFPSVLYVHGYYATCATGDRRYRRPALTMCARRFGPACLVHNYLHDCGTRSPARLLRFYRRQARRLAILRGYRAVLVGSGHMRAVYEQHGLPAERVVLLPLPSTGIVPADRPPAPRGAGGRVLFVGRLTGLKGCDYLIDAMPIAAAALRRHLVLVVAGDGPEAGRLRSRAARRGVSAEFHGWVPQPRLASLYEEADLLAVPSVWPEPFGLVGIEAAGTGLPAVGFAVGGIPDWLRPGVTGELAPADPPTAAGLAAAIVRALDDPAHYSALRQGAWAASRKHALADHVSRLVRVLAAAAGASATAPVQPDRAT